MSGFLHQLEQRSTAEALCEALAERLEDQLRARRCGDRPLGLASGRTMEPLYASLVRRLQAWSTDELAALKACWCSFNLDEYRGLAASDPRSYRRFMADQLGDPLQIPDAALRLPDGSSSDGDGAANAYGAALARSGGIGVQLLGLGSNGHVGFNEPPCEVDLPCRVVSLSSATRQQNAGMFGGDPAAVPSSAITLGLQEILAAEEIHLVVTGAAKASILRRLLESREPDPQLPASWLLRHPRVWLWADTAALATPLT